MGWVLLHPFALWVAVGGLLLAVKVATGSGWLLWPAGAAAVTAALAFSMPLDLPIQVMIFAVLTIVTTLVGRHFFPRHAAGVDINDTRKRLKGLEGIAAADFQAGHGRVFVDGKEWAAELQGAPALARGMKIVVTGVEGARLMVRAA